MINSILKKQKTKKKVNSKNKSKNKKLKTKDKITKKISSLPTTQQYRNKNNKEDNIEKKELNKNKNGIIDLNLININLNKRKSYSIKSSNHILNIYTFEEAIKMDFRSICNIFYIYLLTKQIIFHAFLYRSPLVLFPLRFCLLIFIISSDLALNALFYFDDKISEKYKYAKSFLLFAFSNNILVILLSTLIGFILLTLFIKLSNSTNDIREVFKKEEEKLKKDKNYIVTDKRKIEIQKEIENILKNYKIKVIIFIIIEMILMIFFWYYATAFCHVYSVHKLAGYGIVFYQC